MNRIDDGLMELNMGPQHPSTHGVIRLILKVNGEIIHSVIPDVGYLHRSIEKISEQVGYIGFMPYTDRVDYLSAMHANTGYAMAVEKLAGIEVPRRAEFLRVIVQEFNRIISHFIAIGTYAMDMGAYTPFVYLLREREAINDLLESVCGARLTYNYVWIGGVSHDLPEGFKEKANEYLDHFNKILGEFDRLLTKNTIFINRLKGIGIIGEEDAKYFGLAGPNLRASGIAYDIRRDEPYSVYPELEFDIPVGMGWAGYKGDSYDRFYCRILEMEQSSKIIRQALKMIPQEGEIRTKIPKVFKPQPGESVARVESSRGSMMYYILSDGTIRPVRVKIRTGSFNAMTILEKIGPGMMISDFISFFASLDVDAPEIDR
jgi:NADH-quinone oxidoreductase subunit D